MPDLVLPNANQLRNCASSGWDYLGDGLFAKGDHMGYFTERGFRKV